VATWAWPIWVVSRRRVLEAVFILLEFPSPSRRIFIGFHSLPPLWFAVSVLHTDPIFSVGCPRVSNVRILYASHANDDVFYSRWTCQGLWCHHVLPYVCIPHYEYERQGHTPFKRRVSEVGHCLCSNKRMGDVFIVNGNVWGCFRECWHEKFFFCRYTNYVL
jgi:hypothetical protein